MNKESNARGVFVCLGAIFLVSRRYLEIGSIILIVADRPKWIQCLRVARLFQSDERSSKEYSIFGYIIRM